MNVSLACSHKTCPQGQCILDKSYGWEGIKLISKICHIFFAASLYNKFRTWRHRQNTQFLIPYFKLNKCIQEGKNHEVLLRGYGALIKGGFIYISDVEWLWKGWWRGGKHLNFKCIFWQINFWKEYIWEIENMEVDALKTICACISLGLESLCPGVYIE